MIKLNISGFTAAAVAACICYAAGAATLPASWFQKKTFRADYIQTRTISAIGMKFESSGTIVSDPNTGFILHQISPFSMKLTVTGNKLIQESEGRQEIISKDSNPQLFAVSSGLFTIFTDPGEIDKYFDLKKIPCKKICFKLKPLDQNLLRLLNEINLSGDDFPEYLEIKDTSNDTTSIKFNDYRITELSEDEKESLR